MPHYIFYVYAGTRGTGRAVRTVERDYWSDWLDLKRELEEAAVTAYLRYGVRGEMFVTVERVKYRPKRMAWNRYSLTPTSCRRERMAIFKITYNPNSMRIQVKNAQLAGDLAGLIDEYYAIEKGIKWRRLPVIPKRKRDLKYILMTETGSIINSYIPSLKPQYDFTEDQKYWEGKTTYLVKPKRQYS